jgi:hypothetical protein
MMCRSMKEREEAVSEYRRRSFLPDGDGLKVSAAAVATSREGHHSPR